MTTQTGEQSAPSSLPCPMPAMNDELRWILGRPNFWCASTANVLKADGHVIANKCEYEQAAVIHWMLSLYLEHGDSWRDVAAEEIKRIKAKLEAEMIA